MKSSLYVKSIKNFFLNILFPTKCLGCQKKNEILCDVCVSKIAQSEKELDENILAVFDYQDPLIKKAIWNLKYYHKRYLGERLGQLLYEYLIEDIGDMKTYSGKAICVIPIPISRKRTKTRGYNQAMVIAKGFCQQTEKGAFELKNKVVDKKIDTLPQAKITNKNKRLRNIKGVFEIKDKEAVRGRTIIIIDDVTTTGGTINEVIKILKKAGAKKVIGLAVAH